MWGGGGSLGRVHGRFRRMGEDHSPAGQHAGHTPPPPPPPRLPHGKEDSEILHGLVRNTTRISSCLSDFRKWRIAGIPRYCMDWFVILHELVHAFLIFVHITD